MLLSVKAASVKAGVCASIVYGWVEKKLLPHFRLGADGKRGKIAIAEEDLDAFLQCIRSSRSGSTLLRLRSRSDLSPRFSPEALLSVSLR